MGWIITETNAGQKTRGSYPRVIGFVAAAHANLPVAKTHLLEHYCFGKARIRPGLHADKISAGSYFSAAVISPIPHDPVVFCLLQGIYQILDQLSSAVVDLDLYMIDGGKIISDGQSRIEGIGIGLVQNCD